jgi:hypothetical protein
MGERFFDRLFMLIADEEGEDIKADLEEHFKYLVDRNPTLDDPVCRMLQMCDSRPFTTWSVARLLLTLTTHPQRFETLCCDARSKAFAEAFEPLRLTYLKGWSSEGKPCAFAQLQVKTVYDLVEQARGLYLEC